MSVNDVEVSDVVGEIKSRLIQWQTTMMSFRTAALWFQYNEMIDILKQFIQAERIGDWSLHLKSLSDMLPFLAAAGHNLYTKSVWLYLHLMHRLKEDNLVVYQKLESGYHIVRRSDHHWAGLSTDLVIEQVLMHSVKSTGGLTRGRGMVEHQRLVWLLAMPAYAEINRAMQDLTRTRYETGEQNKDTTQARQKCDMKDTQLILDGLVERSPFDDDPNLRSITSGIIADSNVNVDQAKDVGNNILRSMNGQPVKNYIFRKKAQAVKLTTKSSVQIDGEQVHIDPQLLFQRLVMAARATTDTESLFQYELCSYPPSLFDPNLMLREPQKSLLADVLWSQVPPDIQTPPALSQHAHYVIDAGALIHRLPWPSGIFTYKDVCELYTGYVTKKYGTPTIVFDGYNSSSTKAMTHRRRAGYKMGATVAFDENMHVKLKKDIFLSNKKTMQRLIYMLEAIIYSMLYVW